jgi:arylsulfatase A-like enzyme
MYEESLKMPLIVSWPGVTKPGSIDTHLVQNLDYGETFLDVAGAAIPADMQGRSLVPLLKGQADAKWRDSIYYHYYEYPSVHMVAANYGVRTDRYKLIHYYTDDAYEFFDLKNDPNEINSLVSNPEYTPILEKMKAELDRQRKENGVPHSAFSPPYIHPGKIHR